MLTSGQWFLALLSAAIGLAIASVLWRLPVIERWEVEEEDEPDEPPSPMEESARAG